MNHRDLEGRFESAVYEPAQTVVLTAGLAKLPQPHTGMLVNHGWTKSKQIDIEEFELPNGAIGFMNGIRNTEEDCIKSARQLSAYGGGVKIRAIYNATHTFFVDFPECGLAHLGIHSPPVELMKRKWAVLRQIFGPDAKFLETVHSQGGLHLYNALASSPKSVQRQIIALTINSARLIPKHMCFNSYNYKSTRDFVTHLDPVALLFHKQLIVVKAHPNAGFLDHDFLSITFCHILKGHIHGYNKKHGGKK